MAVGSAAQGVVAAWDQRVDGVLGAAKTPLCACSVSAALFLQALQVLRQPGHDAATVGAMVNAGNILASRCPKGEMEVWPLDALVEKVVDSMQLAASSAEAPARFFKNR